MIHGNLRGEWVGPVAPELQSVHFEGSIELKPAGRESITQRLVRHPLYVGWIVAFWATPEMTTGHLFFAIGLTAQILISIPHEERDIEDALGEPYEEYKRRTPMLIPYPKSKL